MKKTYPVLVNGIAENTLDIADRGLQYGDGIFRTVLVSDSTVVDEQLQLDKLFSDAKRIGLPETNMKDWLADISQIINAANENIIVKLIWTRGIGERGYSSHGANSATRIVGSYPAYRLDDAYWAEGIKLYHCKTRLGLNPSLAGIKHLNRLEQVLARSEFDSNFQEGLVQDIEGRVISGTMSNLFIVREGKLLTPSVENSGIDGVMRNKTINAACELNIKLEITEISLEDVMSSEEVFLTNSLIGIWPVKCLTEKVWGPGLVTRRLQQKLNHPRVP